MGHLGSPEVEILQTGHRGQVDQCSIIKIGAPQDQHSQILAVVQMYQPRTINGLLGQTKILELAAPFERSEIGIRPGASTWKTKEFDRFQEREFGQILRTHVGMESKIFKPR